MSELAVIEIKPEQAPALYVANGLDAYLEQIRQAVNEVPDLSTAKGRARIASLAAQVSRSKTAIEKPGREYLKHLKEQPKIIEAELRRFVTECDNIRDSARKPLTDWEAEQERIKAEEEAKRVAEELAKKVESDHEMALLMNDAFDREQAEKAAEAERQRIAHEEEIKLQAEEKAKREAAEKAQREIDAIAAREREAILAKERAEREQKEAAEKAERDRIAAEQKAEADKQAAIDAERRKALEEAERIRREAEQREQNRLAEIKRIAEEEAQRVANIEHCRAINQRAVADLVKSGVPEDCAKKCVAAIAKSLVSNITIKY